ncbi:MAG: two-component system response regulator AdeR [Natronomonas sp.]|jgi:two-component system response regulator AdeR
MTPDRTANVLIVDDERPLLESYAAMLGTRYEVATASTGDGALDTVGEETDIVLLDRRLPEYSGTELLTAIRERELDCQVLFCSAVVPDIDILSTDPDGYLHKPVGTDELIDAIDRQLREAGQPEPVGEYLRLERLKSALDDAQQRSRLTASQAYQDLLDRLERKEAQLENSQHTAPAV